MVPANSRMCAGSFIARDATKPGNKKLAAVAERPGGIVQGGTRGPLNTPRLPPPLRTRAARYYCPCHNVRQDKEGKSSW
eukprot:3401135-Pyramimonas_sp.AAC.1